MKQRLIDADNIKERLAYHQWDLEDIYSDYPTRIDEVANCMKVVDATPTVDAIPIDFVDEWIRELQGIDADDIEENISNKFIAVTLQALKFKWRKENETD